MIGPVVAAIWGGGTVLLAIVAIYYSARVKKAEYLRDEAIELATNAMNAKQAAEDGFTKAKDFFDAQIKRPITAVMTDEQCENVAKYVAGRVVGTTRAIETIQ